MDAMAQLELTLTDSQTLYPCLACGALNRAITQSESDNKPANERQPTCLSFNICACRVCGHIMARTGSSYVANLTREQAAELGAHPEFPRVRAVIDEHVKFYG